MEIKIDSLTLLGKSSYNITSDICAICRESIFTKCTDCQHKQNNECISVIGNCNHIFHLCCIEKNHKNISNMHRKCPLCDQHWELKKRKQEIKYNGKEKKSPTKKYIYPQNVEDEDTINRINDELHELRQEFMNNVVNGNVNINNLINNNNIGNVVIAQNPVGTRTFRMNEPPRDNNGIQPEQRQDRVHVEDLEYEEDENLEEDEDDEDDDEEEPERPQEQPTRANIQEQPNNAHVEDIEDEDDEDDDEEEPEQPPTQPRAVRPERRQNNNFDNEVD